MASTEKFCSRHLYDNTIAYPHNFDQSYPILPIMDAVHGMPFTMKYCKSQHPQISCLHMIS